MSNLGKFVCFGNDKGGFCWGRIVEEVKVNSPKGWMEAFVLEDRMVCSEPPYTSSNIHSIHGRTIIRCDKIDLKRDVVEKNQTLADFTDDELFLLTMQGSLDAKAIRERGLASGFVAMIESMAAKENTIISDMASGILKERMGIETEEVAGNSEVSATEVTGNTVHG